MTMLDRQATQDRWDQRFLEVAKTVSAWSPDPSSKIGAVAVSPENLPLVWGWNAFPRKLVSLVEHEVAREVKYKFVVHAEANLIYNATRCGVLLKGATFYVYGIPPCFECAKAMVQVGVKRVVTLAKQSFNDKWIESYNDSIRLFQEIKITAQLFYESD